MQDASLRALCHLHAGLPRKGPGSERLARALLADPALRLPPGARAADLGCGNGHAAVLLAESLGAHVTAVDAMEPFIDELRARLAARPPRRGSVVPRVADMRSPGLEPASLELIWSEGAAYAVGVEEALAAWRPLLRSDGVLVFSECCWLERGAPEECRAFWARAYPAMATPGAVLRTAERHGYGLVRAGRLPDADWWASYYDPLAARCAALEAEAASDGALAAAIAGARREMALFRRFSRWYGYVLFALAV